MKKEASEKPVPPTVERCAQILMIGRGGAIAYERCDQKRDVPSHNEYTGSRPPGPPATTHNFLPLEPTATPAQPTVEIALEDALALEGIARERAYDMQDHMPEVAD